MAGQEANKKAIDDYKKDYEYYTSKASEITRNLALAGIAIIWIFKSTSSGDYSIPKILVSPLFWLVIALGLDLLQYVIGGLIWFIYYRIKENQIDKKKIKAHKDLKAPNILPTIIHIFYWSKIIANIVAYILLFKFLGKIII